MTRLRKVASYKEVESEPPLPHFPDLATVRAASARRRPMILLKRAAAGVLSLVIVSTFLVVGHRIARTGSRQTKVTAKQAQWPAVGPIPDCKMPDNPPASHPVDPRAWSEEHGTSPYSSSMIHAVSGREPAAKRPVQEADAGDWSAVPPLPQPLPLPERTNAIPLRPDGPDLPSLGNPPGSVPTTPEPGSPGRRIIERALPNSSPEELDVWHDALKDLAPRDVRELMRLRQELGRMPLPILESHVPTRQPLWQQPAPGPMACEPLVAPRDVPAVLTDAERNASHIISSSLSAIGQAQQVLLNNIANANTDGYKRVLVSWDDLATYSASPRAQGSLSGRILDMSQGKLRRTDRQLDLAIEGEGFFELEDVRTGERFYTRSGRFTTNPKGELVRRASQRELLLRPRARITCAESMVEIAADGTLRMSGARGPSGAAAPENSSPRVQIVTFPCSADLIPAGDNLFVVRSGSEPGSRSAAFTGAQPTGRLRQGCLEESNVEVDRELQELERLRRQVHALEVAAQNLPISGPESLSPPAPSSMVPSHFAGALGHERN
jgi:flagellar basal-body rod protein FlgG